MGDIRIRLPTEAEREFSSRAGNEDAQYGELEAIAWYEANSGLDVLTYWRAPEVSFVSDLSRLSVYRKNHAEGQLLHSQPSAGLDVVL